MWRIAAVTGVIALGAAAPASAGLPEVASGPRPGPDVLYEPPPPAPQLENVTPWSAAPILVSGAAAYRDGEFLYQDFLFDDRGARGVLDPSSPHGVGDFMFSPVTGTATYPADPVYANNAADLVELRVKPLADATAFRVTLNTLKDPERTGFTIAIGASDEPREWPHGAGVRSPAQLFLTVHGTTAELRDAASGEVLSPAPSASVDLRRRQVEVRVPRGAWDPGTDKVRLAAGVGLWDVAAGEYLVPRPLAASATTPGGGSPTGAALFNVAFRFDEPLPDVTQFGAGVTIADAAVGGMVDGAWWRERAQADALLAGDLSRFHVDVDFGKLATGADDDSQVPRTGPINRILASRYEFGQGFDPGQLCGGLTEERPGCPGGYVGQLQPYALYVPQGPAPSGGWGMDLLLHSLSANYNQYSASKNQSQLATRGPLSLVATPHGRGPDGGYRDIAEADTFEVWADVARHYPLDGDRATVSGYSMGAYGAFQLLARWPDLFARGESTVGAARDRATVPSLRNTPLMSWAALADELVNIVFTEQTTAALIDARVRFVHDLFPLADHLTLATADEYGPVADFLAEDRVDRNPPHVTYVVTPGEDFERTGAVADHAYWVSGLRLRDRDAPRGTIDVRSEGFGVGDPPALDVEQSAGSVEGGSRGPMPYVRRSRAWGPAPAAPKADRLVVRADNIATATIDARRARVTCAPSVDVRSDGPVDVRIGCVVPRPRRCSSSLRVAVPRVRGRRVLRVVVTRRGRVVRRVRGRDVRRVVVRRPTRRAFALRVRAVTRGGRTVTVLRHYRACR